jgi:hypothetical protein
MGGCVPAGSLHLYSRRILLSGPPPAPVRYRAAVDAFNLHRLSRSNPGHGHAAALLVSRIMRVAVVNAS